MAKRALCIGVNYYPGALQDLSGCINDARDWSAALKRHGFEVRELLDRKASGRAIREGISKLCGSAKAGDSLVVQFSGHGSYVPDTNGDEPDGTDEAICPFDVGTQGPITDDELFELYSERPRGAKLLVLSDSCFSGNVTRFAPVAALLAKRSRPMPRRRVKFLPPAAFLSRRELSRLGERRRRRAASPPGRYAGLLMSACQDTEESWDADINGRFNGAFTYVALRALSKLGPRATYRNWYKEIRKALPSQEFTQTPELYGSSSMKRWRVLA